MTILICPQCGCESLAAATPIRFPEVLMQVKDNWVCMANCGCEIGTNDKQYFYHSRKDLKPRVFPFLKEFVKSFLAQKGKKEEVGK